MADAMEEKTTTSGRWPPWDIVAGFFQWWSSELTALLPARMRRSWQRREHQIILDFDTDKLALIECRSGTEKPIGECPLGMDQASPPQDLKPLLDRLDKKDAEVVIRLPSEQVLDKTLELPMEAEKDLHTVLGYEMDRQTPFSLDQVYFDHQVIERLSDLKKLKVRMVVVPRSLLENMVQKVVKWGLRPAVVTVGPSMNASRCGDSDINLLPEESRQAADGVWNLMNRLLALSAASLAIVALTLPGYRQQSLISDLRQQTQALEADVREVSALRDKVDRAAAESRLIADLKQRSPAAIAILNELSLLLPDDTWMEVLEVKDGKLEIWGYSSNASALIGILENSRLFTNAAFNSPVIQDPRSGRYRFQITAEVSSGEMR